MAAPNKACPTVTKSTGSVTKVCESVKERNEKVQEKKENPLIGGTKQKFAGGKGWMQDLSTKCGGSRREDAPPISEASQKMPTWEKKDLILGTVRQNRVTVISGDTGEEKFSLFNTIQYGSVI
jgi:HrpA-like RNA helicase